MARLGLNMKLTICDRHRADVKGVFVDVLGAKLVQPIPELDQFKLADGASIGVFYVPANDALGLEDQRKGAWIEIAVDDSEATAKRLEDRGLARIDYTDKTHRYYQLPGGPVFRLAKHA